MLPRRCPVPVSGPTPGAPTGPTPYRYLPSSAAPPHSGSNSTYFPNHSRGPPRSLSAIGPSAATQGSSATMVSSHSHHPHYRSHSASRPTVGSAVGAQALLRGGGSLNGHASTVIGGAARRRSTSSTYVPPTSTSSGYSSSATYTRKEGPAAPAPTTAVANGQRPVLKSANDSRAANVVRAAKPALSPNFATRGTSVVSGVGEASFKGVSPHKPVTTPLPSSTKPALAYSDIGSHAAPLEAIPNPIPSQSPPLEAAHIAPTQLRPMTPESLNADNPTVSSQALSTGRSTLSSNNGEVRSIPAGLPPPGPITTVFYHDCDVSGMVSYKVLNRRYDKALKQLHTAAKIAVVLKRRAVRAKRVISVLRVPPPPPPPEQQQAPRASPNRLTRSSSEILGGSANRSVRNLSPYRDRAASFTGNLNTNSASSLSASEDSLGRSNSSTTSTSVGRSWGPSAVMSKISKTIFGKSDESKDDGERERNILAGKALLQSRLKLLNVQEFLVVDDGNCLFRAISHQLYGTQDRHQFLRTATVDYLRMNKHLFVGSYLGSEQDFANYVKEMSQNGAWGDEIALKTLCENLKLEVMVVLSTEGAPFLRYTPGLAAEAAARNSPSAASSANNVTASDYAIPIKTNLRTIFLSYLSPIHYNSLLGPENQTLSAEFADTIVRILSPPPPPAALPPLPAAPSSNDNITSSSPRPIIRTSSYSGPASSASSSTSGSARSTSASRPPLTINTNRPPIEPSVDTVSPMADGKTKKERTGSIDDGGSIPDNVTLIYENQRLYPVKGWSCKLLPTDRARWSSEDGKTKYGKVKYLPNWLVVVDEKRTDAEGWTYSVDFNSTYPWYPMRLPKLSVRRRQWERVTSTTQRGSVGTPPLTSPNLTTSTSSIPMSPFAFTPPPNPSTGGGFTTAVRGSTDDLESDVEPEPAPRTRASSQSAATVGSAKSSSSSRWSRFLMSGSASESTNDKQGSTHPKRSSSTGPTVLTATPPRATDPYGSLKSKNLAISSPLPVPNTGSQPLARSPNQSSPTGQSAGPRRVIVGGFTSSAEFTEYTRGATSASSQSNLYHSHSFSGYEHHHHQTTSTNRFPSPGGTWAPNPTSAAHTSPPRLPAQPVSAPMFTRSNTWSPQPTISTAASRAGHVSHHQHYPVSPTTAGPMVYADYAGFASSASQKQPGMYEVEHF